MFVNDADEDKISYFESLLIFMLLKYYLLLFIAIALRLNFPRNLLE